MGDGLRKNIGTVAYIDDVLSFPYPVDVLVDYNAYANELSYQTLYEGCEKKPEFLLGVQYAPLREMFQNVPPKEQKDKVSDILLSTGGSDEQHIALFFIKHLCEHPSSDITYHVLIGAMNTDKDEIRSLAADKEWIELHENVVDMRSLISSMDLIISAAGSTLYEICACGEPTPRGDTSTPRKIFPSKYRLIQIHAPFQITTHPNTGSQRVWELEMVWV